jgi:hypothetical protein
MLIGDTGNDLYKVVEKFGHMLNKGGNHNHFGVDYKFSSLRSTV